MRSCGARLGGRRGRSSCASARYRMSLTSVDLPEPLTPVTAVNVPIGIVTSMFFRLLARAPRMTISPRAGRPPRGRRGDRALAARYGAGQRPGRRPAASGGRPWKMTCAAVLARARPQVHHVVGRADRLLVVLDDDHGVAEIAQPRQRGEQLPVVALVQADRRLVEHVQDAGQVARRSASRAGCAALRRPTASPRCGSTSGSRRRRRAGSAAARESRAARGRR